MLIFCGQTNWVCPSGTQRFCLKWLWLESRFIDYDSIRVESFCEKRDSSRVESRFFSTWLESIPSHQKSWLESSHWLESRYHCQRSTQHVRRGDFFQWGNSGFSKGSQKNFPGVTKTDEISFTHGTESHFFDSASASVPKRFAPLSLLRCKHSSPTPPRSNFYSSPT